MAEERARRALARAAARLAIGRGAALLPSLVLMTDDERLSDPLAAARALPRGSMVVIRTRQRAHRVKLAQAVLALARTRHLIVLIADDAVLAAQLGADGLHLPEAQAHTAAHWRALHPRWMISVASHGRALPHAYADAVFLSAVFATPSHPGRAHIGAVRASLIAARLPKPVYALGGIDARNASRLSPAFVGLAAIGALAV
jgi:thiamine-phosphate pyrophosphorylase